MHPENVYPRANDRETVYLKSVVKNPDILVGDFTIYNDFVRDPRQFERGNVLYHYPINRDKLVIGKFCSIACGAEAASASAMMYGLDMRPLFSRALPLETALSSAPAPW